MFRDGYEHLAAWQDAVKLVKAVYKLTARFPADEKAGMTAAMRRLVMAMPGKIAEATARDTPTELAKQLESMRGSIRELESFVTLARHLNYIGTFQQWRMRRRLDAYLDLLARDADALTAASVHPEPPRLAA